MFVCCVCLVCVWFMSGLVCLLFFWCEFFFGVCAVSVMFSVCVWCVCVWYVWCLCGVCGVCVV